MKFSVQQLQKINPSPLKVSEQIDYRDFLDGLVSSDILDIALVDVAISIYKLDMDTFKFDYVIHADLGLACALTLERVPYTMNLEVSETYSTSPDEDEEIYPIEGNTIDTKEIVWSQILMNIPMRVVREDAYEILKERNIVLGEMPSENEEKE